MKKIIVNSEKSKYKNQEMRWTETFSRKELLKAGTVLLHSSIKPVKYFTAKETCFFPRFRGNYEMKGSGYNYYYTITEDTYVDYYESGEYRINLQDGDYMELAFEVSYIYKEGNKIVKDYRK